MTYTSMEDRFWSKVVKSADTESCWVWTGALDSGGYGILRVSKRLTHASRVSWYIHNKEIPGGLFVLHRCDNRLCVNPEHLFLGDHKDNAKDMVAKGRNKTLFKKGHTVRNSISLACGSDKPNSKLIEEQIPAIRSDRAAGMSFRKLAKKYGVSVWPIQRIVNGKGWKHVL